MNAAAPRGAGPVRGVRPVDVGVRPYLMTRGRTRPDRPLPIEALVATTPAGRGVLDGLAFERRTIARLCRRPVSVAEVAARVHLPLGVARVLVADLAAMGVVEVHDAPTRVEDDVPLIQRLIHGVRAL